MYNQVISSNKLSSYKCFMKVNNVLRNLGVGGFYTRRPWFKGLTASSEIMEEQYWIEDTASYRMAVPMVTRRCSLIESSGVTFGPWDNELTLWTWFHILGLCCWVCLRCLFCCWQLLVVYMLSQLITELWCWTEVVAPEDPSLEWKDITDRAANKVFFLELAKGDLLPSFLDIRICCWKWFLIVINSICSDLLSPVLSSPFLTTLCL